MTASAVRKRGCDCDVGPRVSQRASMRLSLSVVGLMALVLPEPSAAQAVRVNHRLPGDTLAKTYRSSAPPNEEL